MRRLRPVVGFQKGRVPVLWPRHAFRPAALHLDPDLPPVPDFHQREPPQDSIDKQPGIEPSA